MDLRKDALIKFLVDMYAPSETKYWVDPDGIMRDYCEYSSEEEVEECKKRLAPLTAAELERLVDEDLNAPDAGADFSYWSKAAHWTPEEAAALSLGKNPRLVNWETLQHRTHVSSIAQKYEQLLELVKRAKDVGQLGEFICPSDY